MFGLGGSEILTTVFVILALILGILALLMPVYVYQIRNRCLNMDKKLGVIIELLSGQKGQASINNLKICPACGTRHRLEDIKCTKCGTAIGL